MPGLEVNSSSIICRKCGEAYGRAKGNFLVSHAPLYHASGYLPYCKRCVEEIYHDYLNVENVTPADAVRQVCRKLDLYWNERIFATVEKISATRSLIISYISKINSVKLAGKSYDDTLKEEGALWVWPLSYVDDSTYTNPNDSEILGEEIEVPAEVQQAWGPGNTNEMYRELEERWLYWMSKYPEDYKPDVGEEAIIRQICNLEIAINHDRAAGKSIDKNVNALNTLLGSANLKPNQKKGETDYELENMPLGVGIQKWEFNRPLPETQKKNRDIRETIKNITTWYLGHACKMVGLKNSYVKAYEDAMNDLRVNRPEFDEEDDDSLLNDIFGSVSPSEEGAADG